MKSKKAADSMAREKDLDKNILEDLFDKIVKYFKEKM